jgi:hypothetical protein
MANTYTKIASVAVGSGGSATIEFTSIPSTYTDILVKLSGRSTNVAVTGNMAITINGSSASLSRRLIYGSGSATASTNNSDGYVGDVTGTTSTASTFSSTEIYFPNYAGSNNKSFSTDNVTENNATEAWAFMVAGLRSNTAAITSISLGPLSPQTWTFAQYSTATLYGIVKS